MVLKKIAKVPGYAISLGGAIGGAIWQRLSYLFPWVGKEELQELNTLPEEFVIEIESFVDRNALAPVAYDIKTREPMYRCCDSCLKAYAIKRAQEMNLDRALMQILSKMAAHETGHNGYYIDKERLVHI